MTQYACGPKKREEWIREVKGEREYMGLWMAGATHPAWPTHWLRRLLGEMSVWGPIVT